MQGPVIGHTIRSRGKITMDELPHNMDEVAPINQYMAFTTSNAVYNNASTITASTNQ